MRFFHDLPEGPRLYQTPPGAPFARALARGTLDRLGPDPVALSRLTIYVATRRAARALQEAFAEEAGGPVLTPRLIALSDVEPPPGSPSAVEPLGRLLTLASLVRAMAKAAPDLAREEAAAALAEQLAALLDEMDAEGAPLSALKGLAPEDHAEHWALSLQFLDILRDQWPALREGQDPEALRALALQALEEGWRAAPPKHPVLIAGEAGRTKIDMAFAEAVARLPMGAVVLPWLDDTLAHDEWKSLGDHPEHPHHDAARLARRLGRPRAAAPWWTRAPEEKALARARLFAHALRPAPVTDAWSNAERDIRKLAPDACAGLSLMEADTPRDEASAIAALMRRALETPRQTVALVSPDRALGRRVAAALERWGVKADDSGGRPLALTPPGVFLSLAARALCAPEGAALDAISFLALMKHPLARAGEERRAHLTMARRFEIFALRGRRTRPGLRGLEQAIESARLEALEEAGNRSDPELWRQRAEDSAARLKAWFAATESALAPLARAGSGGEIKLDEMLAAHRAAVEALAGDELYREAPGEALRRFLDRLALAAPNFGPLRPESWPALLADLIRGEAVRPPGGGHARAFIWGPADARAQGADVIIMGGLNEGAWPEIPQPDGWLSRPMRKDLGLPPLEASVGRLAQDFCLIAGAKEVWLTRARKQEGAPAAASRWLRRLETLLSGYAKPEWDAMRARGEGLRRAALALERDAGDPRPERRPEPRPPAALRPRLLSATEIEDLVRDPYKIYARKILGLSALEPIGAEPDALTRGRLLHKVVERFARAMTEPSFSSNLAKTPRRLFEGILQEELAVVEDQPALRAFWEGRALRFAEWFVPREEEARARGEEPVGLEIKGAVTIRLGSGRDVVLSAKADRIDATPEGYVLIDYKTGAPPSDKQIRAFARQLPIEGAILREGGFFKKGRGGAIAAYRHIRIGPKSPKSETDFAPEEGTEAFADLTLEELRRLLDSYEDESRAYPPRLRPHDIGYASDYDHLSRFGEWGDGTGDDE